MIFISLLSERSMPASIGMPKKEKICGKFNETFHSTACNSSSQTQLVICPIEDNRFSKAGFCDRNEGVIDELEHLDDLPVNRDEFFEVTSKLTVLANATASWPMQRSALKFASMSVRMKRPQISRLESSSEPVSMADALEHLEDIRSFLDQHPDGATAIPELY